VAQGATVVSYNCFYAGYFITRRCGVADISLHWGKGLMIKEAMPKFILQILAAEAFTHIPQYVACSS